MDYEPGQKVTVKFGHSLIRCVLRADQAKVKTDDLLDGTIKGLAGDGYIVTLDKMIRREMDGGNTWWVPDSLIVCAAPIFSNKKPGTPGEEEEDTDMPRKKEAPKEEPATPPKKLAVRMTDSVVHVLQAAEEIAKKCGLEHLTTDTILLAIAQRKTTTGHKVLKLITESDYPPSESRIRLYVARKHNVGSDDLAVPK